MSKQKEFYTKTGWLTRYGLACGYIEKVEFLQQIGQMYLEHGVYTVSWFNHARGKRVFSLQTHSLTEARKEYKRIKGEILSLTFIPA